MQELLRKIKALVIFAPPVPHVSSILFLVALVLCWRGTCLVLLSGTWECHRNQGFMVVKSLPLKMFQFFFLCVIIQCFTPLYRLCFLTSLVLVCGISSVWHARLPGPLPVSIWWATHPLRPFQMTPPTTLSTCKFTGVLSPWENKTFVKIQWFVLSQLICLILLIATLTSFLLLLVFFSAAFFHASIFCPSRSLKFSKSLIKSVSGFPIFFNLILSVVLIGQFSSFTFIVTTDHLDLFL